MLKQIRALCSYVAFSFLRKKRLFVSVKLAFTLVFASVNLFSVVSLFATPIAAADANTSLASTTVNFQGRLNTITGNPADAASYNIEFKIYNTANGGVPLWTEDYLNNVNNGVTVDSNGYYSVQLGSINPFTPNISWGQKMWLTMNIGGKATTTQWDGEMNPRMLLTAVPYAFAAGELSTQAGGANSVLTWTDQTKANTLLLPNQSGTLCVSGDSLGCGFVAAASANGLGLNAPTGNVNLSSGNGSVIATTNSTDSSVPAFAVQNSNSANLLSAYTGTGLIKIGMGQPTLASSGQGDLYVTGNAEVGISLRVGDAANGLNFTANTAPSSSAGLYNGNSRPIKTITQTPVFNGLVVSSNPKGSLTTDFDSSSTVFRNYYNWSTAESTAQSVNMYVQIPVPRDFSALTANDQICFNVYTDDTTGNSKASSIFYDTKNAAQSSADITPSAANQWQKHCTTNIGGVITVDGTTYVTEMITLTAAPNTNIRLGSFSFDYLSAF